MRTLMLQKGADELVTLLRKHTMPLGNRPTDALELLEIVLANVIVKVIQPDSLEGVMKVFSQNTWNRIQHIKQQTRHTIIIPDAIIAKDDLQ